MKTMVTGVGSVQSVCVYALLIGLTCLTNLAALAYDPMAPPGFEQGEIDSSGEKRKANKKAIKRGYILRQIVIYPHSKSAVINGYVVNEGSYLKNAQVEKIEENSVVLKVSGKRRVLILEPPLPKIRH